MRPTRQHYDYCSWLGFPHHFLREFLHSLAVSANKYSIQLKLFAGETGFNFTCFVFSAVLSSVKPSMCLFHRITRALGGVAVDLVFNVARGRLYTVYSRFENRSGTKLAKTTGGSRTQSERRKPTKLRWLRDRCRIPRAAGCPLSEVPFAKHPQSVRIVRASRSEMQCSLVIAEATTPRGVPIDCFPGPAMIGERWRRCWDLLLSLFSFSLLLSPACFSLSLSRSLSFSFDPGGLRGIVTDFIFTSFQLALLGRLSRVPLTIVPLREPKTSADVSLLLLGQSSFG